MLNGGGKMEKIKIEKIEGIATKEDRESVALECYGC